MYHSRRLEVRPYCGRMPTSFHMLVMKKFAQRLKAARVAKYRSAEQFAHKMGLNPHAYRKYERGTAEPKLETLVRMCKDLEITPDDLFPDAAA